MYWNFGNEDFVNKVWPEAEHADSALVNSLLFSAHILCAAYAPALPAGVAVPESYLLAEVLQARDLWAKLHGGNNETFGTDGMEIPVYPLVLTVRTLLRPKSSPLGRLR